MNGQQMSDDTAMTLDELLDRAREHGAQEVLTEPVGQLEGSDLFHARARVVTADGRVFMRAGYARSGDCQGEATEDAFPLPARAETRALRATLRAAYGEGVVEAQEAHIKRAQQAIREAAEAIGVDRDRLAKRAHRRYRVDSVNDLTPDQAHDCLAWCQALRDGKALIEEVTADEDAA